MRPEIQPTPVARRDPALVMRLARLGSFHQCRLSFMRILTRRMRAENWTFSRPDFKINEQGIGHAVYCAHGPERTYSLVAFAHDLPDEQRSDRVIAEAWDSTFTLFDGIPDQADIDRLAANVPLQEAGRVSGRELSLSRANRSARLWEYVVERLANGQQPEPSQIAQVGYLMRTTAVYGSGKFGAADRDMIASRPEFSAPFQAEMLSVFLTRAYVRDLVQHLADTRGGAETARLDPEIARSMGIGNSTGLGMAPFILNHPVLFNNWIMVREEALARVRSVAQATADEIASFHEFLTRAQRSADLWQSTHPIQVKKLAQLRRDLGALCDRVSNADLRENQPWDRLYLWAENQLGFDAQECLVSLMMEPYGALVDGLADCMSDVSEPIIDGRQTVGDLKATLARSYDWALKIDWKAPENCARAWYVSEEKLEPRLGERFEEPIAPYEQPLAPGRDATALYQALVCETSPTLIAEFLLRHPEHRHAVRRAQIVARMPYGEIRDNTISSDLLPIDMLRCKLSFFGATHFDPRSDRWVRICMYAGAPYPEEIASRDADQWAYPT